MCEILLIENVKYNRITVTKSMEIHHNSIYRTHKYTHDYMNDMKKLKNEMRWKMNKQYEMELI